MKEISSTASVVTMLQAELARINSDFNRLSYRRVLIDRMLRSRPNINRHGLFLVR